QQVRYNTYMTEMDDRLVTAGPDPRGESEDFNVGDDTPTSVDQLARRIWQLGGRAEPIQFRHSAALEHDIQRRIPDVTKIERVLGWRVKMSLDEGLRATIDWLRLSVPAA